jgi:tetratricopeptide (TPR) repeat protein
VQQNATSVRRDEGHRERAKEEVLSKSKDSKLRDTAMAQRQSEDYEKSAAANEAQNQNSLGQAYPEDENKKSMAAASPPAEVAPASPPPPASEPQQQAEGGQKYDGKNVAGTLAYKVQSVQSNKEIFQRAQMLIKSNQLSEGKEFAQQAIDQDKSRTLAPELHQEGIKYQKEHETDKAILQFNLLMKNYPDYPQRADVLLRLGDSYRELGQYEEAQKAYEQLLALQPSNKTAAQRLMLLNKRKQAEDQLRSLGYVEKPD